MDDILANAGFQSVPAAPQTPTDVAAQPDASNLGQGEHQAPTPTSDGVQGGSAPSPAGNERTISYAEYEALQQQLAEKDGFVSQLKQMAEANVAEQEWNTYKATAANDVKQQLERAGAYDEDTFGTIQSLLFDRLDGIRNDFNQKFTEYQGQIQGWASDFEWQNTREQEADRLVREMNLNPIIKTELLKAPTREAMSQAAQQAKFITDLYQTQGVNQAIQDQGQQRRNSGVDNIGGGGGPVPMQPLKPGNADEPHLRDALKLALGIG